MPMKVLGWEKEYGNQTEQCQQKIYHRKGGGKQEYWKTPVFSDKLCSSPEYMHAPEPSYEQENPKDM